MIRRISLSLATVLLTAALVVSVGAAPAQAEGEMGSFFAYAPEFGGGVFVAAGDITGDGLDEIITGPDRGGGPHVRAFRPDGSVVAEFFAFDAGFTGGVRVAAGNFDADAADEIVTAAGPGGGPHVRVWDFIDGGFVEKFGFYAYDPSFPGGVYVGAANFFTSTSAEEIVTGAGEGGGPHIRIWSGSGPTEVWGAMAASSALRCGFRVSAGDADGNGDQDVFIGYGPRCDPRIRVITPFGSGEITQIGLFDAYSSRFRGGVYVAGGNVAPGLSRAFAITAPGFGGGPHIRVRSAFAQPSESYAIRTEFMAYDPAFRGGARVGAGRIDGNADDDVITGAGPGGGPHVKIFDD